MYELRFIRKGPSTPFLQTRGHNSKILMPRRITGESESSRFNWYGMNMMKSKGGEEVKT